MRVIVSAELPIDAATYLLERDGAAFRSFIAEEMNLLEYEIETCWREGSATKIKLSSKPDVSSWIPGSLANKIPESLAYYDEVTYRPEELQQPPYTFSIHSECPALGDKGHFTSRTRIEPAGPDRCRHVLEQTIEFKGLWGLGSVAKKLAKKSLESTFNDMPGIIEKWVRLRQELLQTPHGWERLLAGRPRVEGVAWMDEAVAAIKQASAAMFQHSILMERRRSRGHSAGVQSAGPPPVEPASEAAIPALHTPFAAAAAAGGGAAPVDRQGQLDPPAATPGAPAGQAAEADEAEFADARERKYMRQDTGGTLYFTPRASPVPSAGAELPAQPAPAAVGPGKEPPRGAARLQRGPEAEAGVEAEGSASAHVGNSGYSASVEESQSSEEDVEAKWGRVAHWRAYYLQRGLSPSRASRLLPDDLVEYFVRGARPQPVKAERLGVPGILPVRKRRPLRRLFGFCTGTHSSAAD
ncbi:hypothetical protein ABPG75_009881 [Micractinium tetrahymenae]